MGSTETSGAFLDQLEFVLSYLKREGFSGAEEALVKEFASKYESANVVQGDPGNQTTSLSVEQHAKYHVSHNPGIPGNRETLRPSREAAKSALATSGELPKLETPGSQAQVHPLCCPPSLLSAWTRRSGVRDVENDEYDCMEDVGYLRREASVQQHFAETQLMSVKKGKSRGHDFRDHSAFSAVSSGAFTASAALVLAGGSDHGADADYDSSSYDGGVNQQLSSSEYLSSLPAADGQASPGSPCSSLLLEVEMSKDVAADASCTGAVRCSRDSAWELGPMDIRITEPVTTPTKAEKPFDEPQLVLSRVESLTSSFMDTDFEGEEGDETTWSTNWSVCTSQQGAQDGEEEHDDEIIFNPCASGTLGAGVEARDLFALSRAGSHDQVTSSEFTEQLEDVMASAKWNAGDTENFAAMKLCAADEIPSKSISELGAAETTSQGQEVPAPLLEGTGSGAGGFSFPATINGPPPARPNLPIFKSWGSTLSSGCVRLGASDGEFTDDEYTHASQCRSFHSCCVPSMENSVSGSGTKLMKLVMKPQQVPARNLSLDFSDPTPRCANKILAVTMAEFKQTIQDGSFFGEALAPGMANQQEAVVKEAVPTQMQQHESEAPSDFSLISAFAQAGSQADSPRNQAEAVASKSMNGSLSLEALSMHDASCGVHGGAVAAGPYSSGLWIKTGEQDLPEGVKLQAAKHVADHDDTAGSGYASTTAEETPSISRSTSVVSTAFGPSYTIDANGVLMYEYDPTYIERKYENFNLRIVHRKNKTGFEETKDFPVRPGSLIAGRYQVMQLLGSAAFSRAVQALDVSTGQLVCLKIIKNSKDYFDQSLDEIKLLRHVNSMDPNDEHGIVRLLDSFYYKEHLILVCELLRANLYEFQKFNRESSSEVYFTNARIQRIAVSVLKSLVFLHSLGIIHSDLKPENIMVKSYSRCEVKVIDLGSSCFSTDKLNTYVQSRSYRAPEVILGLPYDQKIDIWSLGCILAELSSGHVLFQNNSVATLLARLEGLLGPLPQSMIQRGRRSNHFYSRSGNIYERSVTTGRYEWLTPKQSSLRHRLPGADAGLLGFVSFLLSKDPSTRPTAQEALQHPWLKQQYDNLDSN